MDVNGGEAAVDPAAVGMGVARVLSDQLRPRSRHAGADSGSVGRTDRVNPSGGAGRHMTTKVRAFIDLAAKVLPSRL
jgi:hypothetical protein